MATPERLDRRFREKLRAELASWHNEGLVDSDQAAALTSRYALEDVATRRAGLLLTTIYTFGVVLVAIGVISFVAANWQSIPKSLRMAAVFAVMLGAHISGYVLWRVRQTRPRLGHALVLFGTLVFGANLGLASQMFHVQGDPSNVFAAWTIGAAVIAYCLWSVPNAIVAVFTSFIWYCVAMAENTQGAENAIMLHHAADWYPFALLAVGLPFAYVARSGLVTFCVLLGFAVTAHVPLVPMGDARWLVLMGAAIAVLLSGYGAFHVVRKPPELAGPALALGALALVFFCSALSFDAVARDVAGAEWFSRDRVGGFGLWPLVLVAGLGLALWAWAAVKAWGCEPLRPYLLAVGGGSLLLIAAAVVWTPVPVLVLTNTAIALVGAGLVWCGFETLRRDVFWVGVLLIAALIASRFLEYETGLVVKSAVFVLAGVSVIAAGVSFEQILQRRRPHFA